MAKPPALREPPFSPLELAVLDALAWELKPDFPDLAAQLTAAEPGRRTNTGAGFYNAITLPRLRTGAGKGKATGLFGSIHAVIAGLPDAVGFQIQLRDGRPMALLADAYDQDTRGIDFQRARFDQIFYLDTQGRSRPYVRELSTTQTRADERHRGLPNERPATPRPVGPDRTAPATAVPVAAIIDNAPAWTKPVLREALGVKESTWSAGIETQPGRVSHQAIRTGVWTLAVFLALVLGLAGLPWVFAGVGAFWAGRALTQPPMLTRIAGVLADAGWGTAR